MEYPQQAKIHGMIELLHRGLCEVWERGGSELRVEYSGSRHSTGVYIGRRHATGSSVAKRLGVSGGEALALFRYVCNQGYVVLAPGSNLSNQADSVPIQYIAPAGLLEIGELPDPHARFVAGLEAAIQAIREDARMPEEEKQRGIDWMEEGKQVARPLAVEVIKAMFRGELPML